ncbi:variable surface protein [Plasmodium gonderi]|uniref:Variable surface protein n=1 Tax=Plasmodium gonderi TaxID=77519 RepID=A0A1Y1JPP3_PLAGO|nr:variable surface protein [Plasmodium gonderi]GAW82034.1 variable surface protein [Plasmodium gonderi]
MAMILTKYDHVKTFPTYASKFKELDIFSDIKFVTNDPIVKTCKEKAKQPEGFFFIDLCTRLNKYFDYFSTLKPLDSKHCEYINFWLNDKLKSYNELNLYRRILNHDISLDIFDTRIEDILKYKSKLGVLSNDVVEKINILNKLNEQYLFFLTKKEIGRTVDSELCEHAKKFAEIYNKAIDECSNYNNKYCKALIEFKVKYDKHNGFTRTCPNVQDLTIIPGTRNYELEILRRYASLHGDGTYSVTDVLKTLGKILGGAVVLFLIMKTFLSMKIMIIILVMVVIPIMKTMIVIVVMEIMIVILIMIITMIIVIMMIITIMMKIMGIRYTMSIHITMIAINQCHIMDDITFSIILHVMMNICTTEIKQYSELVNNVIKSNYNYIKVEKKIYICTKLVSYKKPPTYS